MQKKEIILKFQISNYKSNFKITFVTYGAPYVWSELMSNFRALINLLLFVQVDHGEEPDPLHPLGGWVQQQLLFQSEPGTQEWTKPQLSPCLPERPGPEPAAGGVLHCIIPVCGCGLYLCLGQSQPQLKDSCENTWIWTSSWEWDKVTK